MAHGSTWASLRRRDPHGRRPFQRRAVGVHRRPVHHAITRPAVPAGVPSAAVAEAGLMAY